MDSAIYKTPEAQLEGNLVYCRDCGGKISPRAATCPNCGGSQTAGGKNKVAAGLLAVFLGALGIHRFYLGQWWGVFYLLFSWTLLPGLIAAVEGLVFLCTPDENWMEKHGHKKGLSALVLVLVTVFALVPVIGILAAVSIPAYQDYVQRAEQAQLESNQ